MAKMNWDRARQAGRSRYSEPAFPGRSAAIRNARKAWRAAEKATRAVAKARKRVPRRTKAALPFSVNSFLTTPEYISELIECDIANGASQKEYPRYFAARRP